LQKMGKATGSKGESRGVYHLDRGQHCETNQRLREERKKANHVMKPGKVSPRLIRGGDGGV